MVRKKGQKQWQTEAWLEAHDQIKKVLIDAEKGLTKTDLYKTTRLARTTIDRHLQKLMNIKQVQKLGKLYYWGDKYNALVKGLKEDAALIEELGVLVGRQKELIAKMSRPENITRWLREATPPDWYLGMPKRVPVNTDPDVPASVTLLTREETREFFECREKVFGGLRCVFFDLAKVVMKVDVGFIDAEEDMSNVTISFRNGRAGWSLNPIKP